MSPLFVLLPTAAVFDRRLRHSDFRVLCGIQLRYGAAADGTTPQRALAARLGLKRETVGRSVRRLEKWGYLRFLPTYSEAGGTGAYRYWVTAPAEPQAAPARPYIASDNRI